MSDSVNAESPSPAGAAFQRFRRGVLRWGAGLLLLGGLGFALWTWFSLTYVYSKGERAGFVQKFSKRGWVFKTWEGDLAMVNLPGAMTEIFPFTVRDPVVALRLEQTMGNRVVLTYNQHRGIPSRIFGETQCALFPVQYFL